MATCRAHIQDVVRFYGIRHLSGLHGVCSLGEAHCSVLEALRLVERRAYPTLQTVDLQQVLLEQFVIGVSDPEVRKNLLRQQPSTLDDAVCLALQEALQAVCAAPPRDLLRVASVRQKLADDVGTLQSFLAAPAPRGRTTGADIHPVAPPVLGPAALFSQSTSSLRTATMITALRLVERRAYPTLQTVDLQQVLLEQFVIGVSDPEVRKNLLRQQPSTLDDAVCLALQEALQAVCAAPPRDLLRVASVRQKLADDVGTLQSFLAAPAPRGRTTGADIHPVAPPVLGPAALFSQSTSSLRTATMITFPLTDYLDCLTPHSPGQHSTRSRNPSLNSILWPLEVSFKIQLQD
ncbi:hypothetical protein SprV_0301350900 [Sparganum proliferum]